MLHLDAGYCRAKVSHFDLLQSAMPPTEKYCLNKLRYHKRLLLERPDYEVLKNANSFLW